MSVAERWLRDRVYDAPPALLEAMVNALPSDSADVPNTLAEAALNLYASVVAGQGGREDALPLLAADALFAHAFEAQAELDPAGIAALAERWGAAGKLGELAG